MKITPPPNFLAKQFADSFRALLSIKDHVDTGSGLMTLPELVAIDIKAKRQDSTQYALVSSDYFTIVKSFLLTASPELRQLFHWRIQFVLALTERWLEILRFNEFADRR